MFKCLGEQYFSNIGHYKDLEMFIDNRGKLEIDSTAIMGFRVAIFTMAHYPTAHGTLVKRAVIIKKNAFIGSYSILYNCVIGEGAMVSVGSVVRSRKVADYTMVEGNPAKEIAHFNVKTNKWDYYDCPKDLEKIV